MASQTDEKIERTYVEATIMKIMINGINNQYTVKRSLFLEIVSLRQGVNKFGHK